MSHIELFRFFKQCPDCVMVLYFIQKFWNWISLQFTLFLCVEKRWKLSNLLFIFLNHFKRLHKWWSTRDDVSYNCQRIKASMVKNISWKWRQNYRAQRRICSCYDYESRIRVSTVWSVLFVSSVNTVKELLNLSNEKS